MKKLPIRKNFEMADYVQDQIEEHQVPMYKILAEFPMQDETALDNFHTDEEAEQDDQEEDMKEYQRKLNEKIDVLVDALKEVHKIITSDEMNEKKKNVTQHFDNYIKENTKVEEEEMHEEDH